MSKLENHIEAKIRFLLPEEGGRRKFPFSGYRPQFYCDGEDWIVSMQFEGTPPPNGEYFTVYFSFMRPSHQKHVYAGKEFKIREGGQIVAEGEVTRILDTSLTE